MTLFRSTLWRRIHRHSDNSHITRISFTGWELVVDVMESAHTKWTICVVWSSSYWQGNKQKVAGDTHRGCQNVVTGSICIEIKTWFLSAEVLKSRWRFVSINSIWQKPPVAGSSAQQHCLPKQNWCTEWGIAKQFPNWLAVVTNTISGKNATWW